MYLGNRRVRGKSFDSGFKKFDPPIKKERLIELFTAMKTGDLTGCEEVIRGHMGLSCQIVSRYVSGAPKKSDDLLGVALMALVQAVAWLPARCAHDNPGGYIVETIHSQLSDFIARDQTVYIPRSALRKLAKEYNEAEIKEDNIPETLSYQGLDAADKKAQIARAMTTRDVHENDVEVREIFDHCNLTRFETIVVNRKMEGMSDAEIGRLIGVSRARVGQVKDSVTKKLLPHFRLDEPTSLNYLETVAYMLEKE